MSGQRSNFQINPEGGKEANLFSSPHIWLGSSAAFSVLRSGRE
jgi:hypothetical protein